MARIYPSHAAELANTLSPHVVIPLHYGKLLGGTDAPHIFSSMLNGNVIADIRPSVYSNILVSMYIKTFVPLLLLLVTIFLLDKYII